MRLTVPIQVPGCISGSWESYDDLILLNHANTFLEAFLATIIGPVRYKGVLRRCPMLVPSRILHRHILDAFFGSDSYNYLLLRLSQPMQRFWHTNWLLVPLWTVHHLCVLCVSMSLRFSSRPLIHKLDLLLHLLYGRRKNTAARWAPLGKETPPPQNIFGFGASLGFSPSTQAHKTLRARLSGLPIIYLHTGVRVTRGEARGFITTCAGESLNTQRLVEHGPWSLPAIRYQFPVLCFMGIPGVSDFCWFSATYHA